MRLRHWKPHSFSCISTAPPFLAASPPPTLQLASLEISLSEASTKEPSLTLEEQASVYTENLPHYTHTQGDASITASHRKQSSLFLKLPFWLLRLVKPCSVKRFFDSTEHSEVELVLSTKEERDTEREKAMKRSRQKVIRSCAREPACYDEKGQLKVQVQHKCLVVLAVQGVILPLVQ